MLQKELLRTVVFGLIIFTIVNLSACAMIGIGRTVIAEPDEYSHIYEAKEKYILQAIARVFKERDMGKNVHIDESKNTVDSDFIVRDNWRTKGAARLKRLNWKECEVLLTVTTEKKTEKGWEMRRLLGREQYEKIFDAVNRQIYEEMYKTE
ncbi:MAG: hypothetical protein JW943_02275 [Deltaproteobacteria bacterium]|nr:hypothetical protein [Deltaproteobacteria bacterium]